MELIEKLQKIIEREIDNVPMVLTDPLTLRRLRAERLAQAVLTALIEHVGGDGVTEGDRDAAKSLLGRDDAGPSWWSIDSGNADNDRLVQAFARHRALGIAQERARIVAKLRDLAHESQRKAAAPIADAIERGEV